MVWEQRSYSLLWIMGHQENRIWKIFKPSHQLCQYLHLDKIPRCFSWTVKFGRNCPQPQFSFASMHCVQHTIYYSRGVKTVLEMAQGQSSGLNTIPYTCTKGNCCQVWREKADVEMYLVSWGRSAVSAHSEPHCNAHSGLPLPPPTPGHNEPVPPGPR